MATLPAGFIGFAFPELPPPCPPARPATSTPSPDINNGESKPLSVGESKEKDEEDRLEENLGMYWNLLLEAAQRSGLHGRLALSTRTESKLQSQDDRIVLDLTFLFETQTEQQHSGLFRWHVSVFVFRGSSEPPNPYHANDASGEIVPGSGFVNFNGFSDKSTANIRSEKVRRALETVQRMTHFFQGDVLNEGSSSFDSNAPALGNYPSEDLNQRSFDDQLSLMIREDMAGDALLWNTEDMARGDLVLSRLYLGGHVASANNKWLLEANISHILCVGTSLAAHFPTDYVYYCIDIYDSEASQLYPFFDGACRFIDEGRIRGTGVLVHCAAGMSRSATLVIAYIMLRWRCSFARAYQHTFSRRYCVPNDGFQDQLKLWQAWTMSGRRACDKDSSYFGNMSDENMTFDDDVDQMQAASGDGREVASLSDVSEAAEWLRQHSCVGALVPSEVVITLLKSGSTLDGQASLENLYYIVTLLEADSCVVNAARAWSDFSLAGFATAACIVAPWPRSDSRLANIVQAFTERIFRSRSEYDSLIEWLSATEITVRFMSALALHVYVREMLVDTGGLERLQYLEQLCHGTLPLLDNSEEVANAIVALATTLVECLSRIASCVTKVDLLSSPTDLAVQSPGAFDRLPRVFLKQGVYDECGVGFKVWPSARMMARWMSYRPALFERRRVIELGAGPGALGMVAGQLGASFVRCTDYLAPIVDLIRDNAALNMLDQVCASHLDWNDVVNSNLQATDVVAGNSIADSGTAFEVILAADVVYTVTDTDHESETPLVMLFARTLAVMLTSWWPRAVFFGAMQRTREGVEAFEQTCLELGLEVVREAPDAELLHSDGASKSQDFGDSNIWYIFTITAAKR